MTESLPPGIPEVIRQYRLVRLLGQGAMGMVFEASDQRDASRVALKIVHPYLVGADPSFRERFEREAHVAALLHSPYTVRLIDFGAQDGRLFLVMEYIDGQSLSAMVADGPLETTLALRIASEAARALEEAEARGVVHRDIKPDNILIENDGRVKVSDFGIARSTNSGTLTVPGSFVGTPAYAAPEQADGVVDKRSDIYSLGVTLYEMLTGGVPYGGATPLAVMMEHRNALFPASSLSHFPDVIQSVTRRALEKDPLDRYQTAAEFAGALDRARQLLTRQGLAGPAAGGGYPRHRGSSSPVPAAPRPTSGTGDAATVVRRPTGETPAAVRVGTGSGQPVTAENGAPPAGRRVRPLYLAIAGGVLVVAAAIAGTAVALSGGGKSTGGPPPSAVAGVVGNPSDYLLQAIDYAYDRGTLAAPPHTKVTFTLRNSGPSRHSLQFKDKKGGVELAPGATGPLTDGGQTTKLTFTTPGPGNYYFECSFNPELMNGVLQVRADAPPPPGDGGATTTAARAASPTDAALPSVTPPTASSHLGSGKQAQALASERLTQDPTSSASTIVLKTLQPGDRVTVVTNTPAASTVTITEGLVFWRVVLNGTQTVGWVPEVTVDGKTRFLDVVQ